jgi:hypothetical protein
VTNASLAKGTSDIREWDENADDENFNENADDEKSIVDFDFFTD